MQESVTDMDLARQAMDEISSTSKNISKVIKKNEDSIFPTLLILLSNSMIFKATAIITLLTIERIIISY